jgi:hypothetical protein
MDRKTARYGPNVSVLTAERRAGQVRRSGGMLGWGGLGWAVGVRIWVVGWRRNIVYIAAYFIALLKP